MTKSNKNECIDLYLNGILDLIKSLVQYGQTILDDSWKTKEDSRRIQIHPEVNTWYITMGKNNECRPFVMGMNVYGELRSNIHKNFTPPFQR